MLLDRFDIGGNFDSLLLRRYDGSLVDAGIIEEYRGPSATLTDVKVKLKKVGSPTSGTIRGILHSGASGTERLAYSTNTQAVRFLTSAYRQCTFTFNDSVVLGNYVGVVVSDAGTMDMSNYATAQIGAAGTGSATRVCKITCSVPPWCWSATAARDLNFEAYGTVPSVGAGHGCAVLGVLGLLSAGFRVRRHRRRVRRTVLS